MASHAPAVGTCEAARPHEMTMGTRWGENQIARGGATVLGQSSKATTAEQPNITQPVRSPSPLIDKQGRGERRGGMTSRRDDEMITPRR